MKPFIDNQRGATARYKAHKAGVPKPLYHRTPLFVWVLVAAVIALVLTYGR